MDPQNRHSYSGEENYYSQKDKIVPPPFRLFGQRLLPIFIGITTLLLVVVIILGAVIVHLLTTSSQDSPRPVVLATPTTATVPLQAGIIPTTVAPTATPISKPAPNTVLCQADPSWSGSSDWKIFNGMLVNDGTSNQQSGPTILAPCDLGDVTDYAVEANIQVVYWPHCCDFNFAMVVRAVSSGGSWQGYSVGDQLQDSGSVSNVAASPGDFSTTLASAPFDPGSDYHTYRVEVKGNRIRLLIDGGTKLDVTNNTSLSAGQVGFWSSGVQLDINSFKIIAL